MPLDRRSFREACAWSRLLARLEAKWDDDREFVEHRRKLKQLGGDAAEIANHLQRGLQLLGGYASAIVLISSGPCYSLHAFEDCSDSSADAEEDCIAHFRGHPDVSKFLLLLGKEFNDITPDELEGYIYGVEQGWWGYNLSWWDHEDATRSLLDYLLVTNGGAGAGLAIDYADFLYLEFLAGSPARNRDALEAKRKKYGAKASHFGLEVDPGWHRYLERFAKFDLRVVTISGKERSMSVRADDVLGKIVGGSLCFFPDARPEQLMFVNGTEALDATKWRQRLFDLNIGPEQMLTCILSQPLVRSQE